MERVVAFFLRKPLLVNLLAAAPILFGAKVVLDMQKEAFPNLTFRKVIVTTFFPGASARDVEINLTVPIEDALEEVEGVREIVSVSRENISTVEVVLDDDASDEELQQAKEDVDTALGAIDDLPDDIDGSPTSQTISNSDIAIVEVAFSGEHEQLKRIVPYMENRIRGIEGVSITETVGLPDEEVRILVDPVKARQKRVDLLTIARAIQARNLEGSGGTLESFIGEKKVVSFNKFQEFSDVLDTHLLRSAEGLGVQLKEVATIAIEPENRNLLVRNNGERGASLIIKKKTSADIIEVITGIETLIAETKLPQGVEVRLINDQSRITRNRLSIVSGNAVVGFILVLAVLFFVFDFRTAIWTAFGIPFSVMAALIVLHNMGLTLNALTLGGFIVVLGMLVDDAIIVAEQYNSRREAGDAPAEAATRAVGSIWLPVLASSLTTMMAFSPIMSLGGLPGQFVWVIPLIVVLCLLFSLFDSYFLMPVHLSHGADHGPQAAPEKKAFVVRAEKLYRELLSRALPLRYLILLGFVAMLIGSVLIVRLFMKQDAFPQEGAEGFRVTLTLPVGFNQEQTEAVVKKIEERIEALPKEEIVGYSARIGTHSTNTATDRGTQDNLAVVFVYLSPYSDRDRNVIQILDEIRAGLAEQILPAVPREAGETVTALAELIRIGPPLGKSFEIRVIANDDAARLGRVEEIKKFVREIDGVTEVDDDEIAGRDEINLIIDHRLLAAAGLTVEDVLSTLRIAFDGQVVTDVITLDRQVNFRLMLNQRARGDLNFVHNLPLLNRSGNLINLDRLITAEEQHSKGEIRHVNGHRTTTVYGDIDRTRIQSSDVTGPVAANFRGDEHIGIEFSGESVETAKIFGNMGTALLTAVLGTYLIIVLIFNSFTRPLIVMTAVPFGVIGVILANFTHGLPMSMFAGIGVIGLTGVVINDSIVMVFTVLELAGENDAGHIPHDVLVEGAVSRLRPILLTTATTVLGILPTAYGIGGYDPFLSQMCLSLGYGLLFGTIVILFLVPILFTILHDVQAILDRKLRDAQVIETIKSKLPGA